MAAGVDAFEVELHTNAAGNGGLGAFCQDSWGAGSWSKN